MYRDINTIAEVLSETIFGIDPESIIKERQTPGFELQEDECLYTSLYNVLTLPEKEIWDSVLALAITLQVKTGDSIIDCIVKTSQDIAQAEVNSIGTLIKDLQESTSKILHQKEIPKQDIINILSKLLLLSKIHNSQLPAINQKINKQKETVTNKQKHSLIVIVLLFFMFISPFFLMSLF